MADDIVTQWMDETDAFPDYRDYQEPIGEQEDSEYSCPRCLDQAKVEVKLKICTVANGYDDYATDLICPRCFYTESE